MFLSSIGIMISSSFHCCQEKISISEMQYGLSADVSYYGLLVFPVLCFSGENRSF
jgi:hypothetical protein